MRAAWRPISPLVRMIDDHPWLGTGQGTFAYAFPAYRSPNVSLWGVWDLAHNTLLEIAADMGVPLAALVVAAWLAVFVVLVRGAFVRRGGLAVPVAGLAVAILAVLHSLIDFSLQIPGFAIVALCLVGAGLAQSFPRRAVELGPPISAQGVSFHPDRAIEAGGDGVRYRHVGPIGGLIITSVFQRWLWS